MTSVVARQRLLELMKRACEAGARQGPVCALLGVSARTVQRWQDPVAGGDQRMTPGRVPHNKLSVSQREGLLKVLNSGEYTDLPPSQIVPLLADKGVYLASESTLYRVLREAKQLGHRHAWCAKQHRRPRALKATGPNQLYSWDITYLPSEIKGVYYYLYAFMDIFSRKLVGWQVHESQRSEDGAALLKDIYEREGVQRDQVVLHSDNGTPMKGVSMCSMMQTLGVMPSYSRPSVSDDNPYSEALFRTVKYAPQYPEHFTSVAQARDYFEGFVQWYNEQHRHSGIKFVTPAQRHRGEDKALLSKRKAVYEQAKAQHPARWNGRDTRNWDRSETVHLNPEKVKPQKPTLAEAA